MAEDRLEYLSLTGEIDVGMSLVDSITRIERANVRDMASALILKVVYQFTKPSNSPVVVKFSCSTICVTMITICSSGVVG